MKKFYSNILTKLFFAALLFNPFTSFSQLTENFDASTLPAGWIQIDNDGDGLFFRLYNIGVGAAHSGTNVAGSKSFNNTALTPDNWLITPQLNVSSATDSITYWEKTLDASYPVEHYAVLVSTSGTSITNFTTTLYETTLSAADAVWKRKAFSLSAFTGQQVYIAFRHFNSTDNFMVCIDDVTGPALVTGMEDINNTAFTIYPNPAHNFLKVTAKNKIESIKVINIVGEVVFSGKVDAIAYTLNTSAFQSGVYLMQMQTGSSIVVKRFVVQ